MYKISYIPHLYERTTLEGRIQVMERENLKSRLGFILLSAGCAIGVGNVWKFPYITGLYGGGMFVLFYFLFLIIIGLPILTMEFAVGRASKKSPVMAFKALEKPKQKWHLHGYASLIGNYLLVMFYSTVSGWMFYYFYLSLKGSFVGATSEAVKETFANMTSTPETMLFWMVLVVTIGIAVCAIGLQKGIEKISKIMMILLLGIIIILAINSILMDGAGEGLSFYLLPNVERMKEIGIIKTIVAAMNQAFFTLSLGIGSMAIFGSYIGKEKSLLGESVNIVVLDTFVAVSSGLIIFPACFSFGVNPDSGPNLIFLTLPNIFANMPGGRIWGSLFFLFMSFAALTTIIAVFENIISCVMDAFNISRKKACLINFFLIIILSLPCVYGFGALPQRLLSFLGSGSTVLDLESFIVEAILLPLGSLIFLLFCVSRYGWGFKNYMDEVNQGEGLKMKKWMRPYLTYVLPLIVIFIFLFGIYDKFF